MRELKPWLSLILQRRRRLLLGALLMFLTLVSGLGLLALSGWFITATAVTGLLLAAGLSAALNIYVPGGGIRLFAITRTVTRYLERVYNHDTVLRLLSDTRGRLFLGLAHQAPCAGVRLRGADWLTRLTSDLDALDTLYLRLVAPTGLAVVASALVVLLAWLWLSPALALATGLALACALLLATTLLYRRTRHLSAKRSEQFSQLRGQVIEHLEGQAELRAAGLAPELARQLCDSAKHFCHLQARVDVATGWHQAISGWLVNLAALAALWFGLELFGGGQITGPVAVILPLSILGLLEAYTLLPDAFGRLGATEASARRLNKDCGLAKPAMAVGAQDLVTAPGAAPLNASSIDLNNITIRHAAGPALLQSFDLAVRKGEWLGILGASGCGKSSLADALAGVSRPAAGEIRRAADVTVAYLTQQTVLFDDTVRSNLVPDGQAMADERLWHVLELVGLEQRIARIPGQLDGWLGAYGTQLSGGESRRLALARVLLRDSDLVILDEPFTGVDAQSQARICQQLRPWLQGRAVVALGHGAMALPPTDRTVRLG
ncbi:thiol reductant ABC exporter subunit CydC [Marinobacter sp. SS21]|uniref:thiol reductant ABC exporter subunit CydC n=1 Tax=Marinobacter sp. SS21 TaxID=2979460 RepID=UPI00232BB95F|nr:thiol reductant ABC exporter subunit CydC [Marinobacter sp. SS21]MDC0664321.1 thiol reductant ABC exporter subunit CydC [Marinobacter sp. SS21]